MLLNYRKVKLSKRLLYKYREINFRQQHVIRFGYHAQQLHSDDAEFWALKKQAIHSLSIQGERELIPVTSQNIFKISDFQSVVKNCNRPDEVLEQNCEERVQSHF